MDVSYRSVDGLDGYRVGDDGSVWTRMKTVGFQKTEPVGEWRRLKMALDRDGYPTVYIRRKRRWVHLLVLEEFVGSRPDGCFARHFPDRTPTNCRLENLSWGTRKENEADKKIHGTAKFGSSSPAAKLTESDVAEIRSMAQAGVGSVTISKRFAVGERTIRKIVSGKLWRHIECSAAASMH